MDKFGRKELEDVFNLAELGFYNAAADILFGGYHNGQIDDMVYWCLIFDKWKDCEVPKELRNEMFILEIKRLKMPPSSKKPKAAEERQQALRQREAHGQTPRDEISTTATHAPALQTQNPNPPNVFPPITLKIPVPLPCTAIWTSSDFAQTASLEEFRVVMRNDETRDRMLRFKEEKVTDLDQEVSELNKVHRNLNKNIVTTGKKLEQSKKELALCNYRMDHPFMDVGDLLGKFNDEEDNSWQLVTKKHSRQRKVLTPCDTRVSKHSLTLRAFGRSNRRATGTAGN